MGLCTENKDSKGDTKDAISYKGLEREALRCFTALFLFSIDEESILLKITLA